MNDTTEESNDDPLHFVYYGKGKFVQPSLVF